MNSSCKEVDKQLLHSYVKVCVNASSLQMLKIQPGWSFCLPGCPTTTASIEMMSIEIGYVGSKWFYIEGA